MAIIQQMIGQVLRGSAGDYQADERAGVAWIIGDYQTDEGQVSRGSAGDYQSDERAGVARLSWRLSSR